MLELDRFKETSGTYIWWLLICLPVLPVEIFAISRDQSAASSEAVESCKSGVEQLSISITVSSRVLYLHIKHIIVLYCIVLFYFYWALFSAVISLLACLG